MKKLVLVVLVMLYVCLQWAQNKYYVVIGQSNAYRLAQYGNLEAKLSKPGIIAHVINCAHSGEPIEKFIPSWDIGTFYGDCLNKIGNKPISGIVFWQGEQNTLDGSATTWGEKARATAC